MVYIVGSLIGAAAFLAVTSAAPMPRPDGSAIGVEAGAVSAPNGVLMSDPPISASTVASATMTDTAVVMTGAPPSSTSYSSSWAAGSDSSPNYGGSSNYGSSDSSPSYGSSGSSSHDSSYSPPSYGNSYSSPSYGSGSQTWSSSSYDDCVQQCSAKYGSSNSWSPSTTSGSYGGDSGSSSSSEGSVSGSSGVTHTVIVAPTQGVLRYIPFSLNASVGDTVSFQWGAGPHTVTKSSALTVCNKTLDKPFGSGPQNKSFTFNQVINDTNPIWFYCGIPTHCQKGMFGGINIGQADPTGTSSYIPLSSQMTNLLEMNSDMSSMWTATKTLTGSDVYANSWGMSTNVAGMTSDAMMQVVDNVMFMQALIAKNPSDLQNGTFVPRPGMSIPANLIASNGSVSGSPTSDSASTAAAATNPPSNASKNGAGSITASSAAVGLVAVVATFLAL